MTAGPSDFVAGREPLPAWRQQVAAFWRWWWGEMVQLVPERFGGSSGGSRVPLIALETDAFVLVEARGASPAQGARAPIASLDAEGRRIALRDLLGRAGETEGRLRLCLARDESLLRRVALPIATEENLDQVLAFEMDRLTPFRAEEVYFDHRVVSRDPAVGRIQVDIGLARRELLDAKLANLAASGASVQGVLIAEDALRSTAPLDLLPEGRRGERELSRERTLQWALSGSALALLAIALLLPPLLKRETVKALHPELAKAKQEAEATEALHRELEKLAADHNFLLAKKHGSHAALAVIEEISRLLPDNTWVQQLDVRTSGKAREAQISGETASSSKLIEILEQSTVLQNASPRGTVTRGSQAGTERFLIAAEVRPRALPEMQPVSAMPALTSAAPPASLTPAAAPSNATTSPSAPVPVRPADAKPATDAKSAEPRTAVVPAR